MAISDKERARQIIDQLPDDATLDDIVSALGSRNVAAADAENGGATFPRSSTERRPSGAVENRPVQRQLVRRGHVTVLEPVVPVPTITAELTNALIDKMRREREDQFLGLTESDS